MYTEKVMSNLMNAMNNFLNKYYIKKRKLKLKIDLFSKMH
jgi:hypothetical protein